MLSTAVDPVTVNSNGALWYDNITGAYVRRETVHAGFETFAKAAGLGDMESLNVAPTPTYTPTPTDVYTRTPSPSPSVTLTPTPTITPSSTPGHFGSTCRWPRSATASRTRPARTSSSCSTCRRRCTVSRAATARSTTPPSTPPTRSSASCASRPTRPAGATASASSASTTTPGSPRR
ncbi:MAG: hypothetical protein U0470_06020 [Anaerolineae bacterium]